MRPCLEEEVDPPFYRKLSVDGQLLRDAEPYLQKRSDHEPECTCIDALTLQLRHQTTDIYVAMVGGEFALQIRRNHFASVWSDDKGLAPARQPDLPFGNCWTSGAAANVHVIDRGAGHSVDVLVTDEQGTLHRFAEFFHAGRHAGYYPLPGSGCEQDARAMSLTQTEGKLELTRRFGTKLWFDFTGPAVELRASFVSGEEIHHYYRLERAWARHGGCIRHEYGPENTGLTPDAISYASRRMTLQKNTEGLIERVVDLRGNEHRYEYRAPALPTGAPLLVRRYTPPSKGVPRSTSYDYAEASATGANHATLSLIADPLQNTYRFVHGDPYGSGRLPALREVRLPDGVSITRIFDYSQATERAEPSRVTFVSDAMGHGKLLEFSGRQTADLSGPQWARRGEVGPPRLTLWTKLRVSHYAGNRHRFDSRTARFRPGFFTKLLLRETYKNSLQAPGELSKGQSTARAR